MKMHGSVPQRSLRKPAPLRQRSIRTPAIFWSVCRQAAKVLVEQYKRLRTDDAAPGSATAYRITVRQLEALVRLSEALARVHCSDTILPSYVREARTPHARVALALRTLHKCFKDC